MMQSPLRIRRVLISVSDKSNVLEFAQSLVQRGIQLLSTGGTAKMLTDAGLSVLKISDYIGLPEIMNGRIKTLHYKIYAGILGRQGIDDAIMNQYNIQPIDMVVVNFYSFILSHIKNKESSQEEIIENIDISGPSMVRAAAKNYKNVVTVINSNDYKKILDEINRCNGLISLNTRFNLAAQAFKYVTKYDQEISDYFNYQLHENNHNHSANNDNYDQSYHFFPKNLNFMNLKFIKKQNMRYGENPHQRAALYVETRAQKKTGSIATSQQLQGKPLSYNNIIDTDTALECVKMFVDPTCVIVKHMNPCGVATSNTIYDAYIKAYQSDPISAFGGIIAFNRTLDKNTTQAIIEQQFVEVIVAPNIHQDCFNILSNKKHIRVLKSGMWTSRTSDIDVKRINKGLLIQDYDIATNLKNLEIVTLCQPTEQEMKDALFCWKIVKFVKSNAIVCGKNYQTTGIGTGQMNRVYAAQIATSFKKQESLNIKGSVMASDAFFPFPDIIHIASKMNIGCIIQPGGSIRDQEIIKIANQYNIAMLFTHVRHFRH